MAYPGEFSMRSHTKTTEEPFLKKFLKKILEEFMNLPMKFFYQSVQKKKKNSVKISGFIPKILKKIANGISKANHGRFSERISGRYSKLIQTFLLKIWRNNRKKISVRNP